MLWLTTTEFISLVLPSTSKKLLWYQSGMGWLRLNYGNICENIMKDIDAILKDLVMS